MRIWITRPEPQAEKTQARLQALGIVGLSTWCQPVMAIEALAALDPVQRQSILNLDHYHVAIFVSQNAVRFGMDTIDQYWPQLPAGIHWFAIGQATARALAEHGLMAEAPRAAMDTEELLSSQPLQDLSEQKVIIFKGVGGRTTLADNLKQRGAKVDYCELYQRRWQEQSVAAVARHDFGLQAGDITLAYSGESAELILKTLQQAGRQEILTRPIVVPGQRVAGIAAQLGFERVITAQNATDQAMLEALQPLLT